MVTWPVLPSGSRKPAVCTRHPSGSRLSACVHWSVPECASSQVM
jgi:hypothetical protein